MRYRTAALIMSVAATAAVAQTRSPTDQPLHIPLHTTSWNAAGAVVLNTLRGDASSNWTRIQPGTPVAAARAWVCR